MAEVNEPQQLSEKELAAKRIEITDFYKENIKHLKIQLQYEEMLRDIEKARAERVQAQMFLSQAMAEPPKENHNGSDLENVAPPLPKRTLKRTTDEI